MTADELVTTNTRFYNGGIQVCVTFPKEIKENKKIRRDQSLRILYTKGTFMVAFF